jgi:hypothetical protein
VLANGPSKLWTAAVSSRFRMPCHYLARCAVWRNQPRVIEVPPCIDRKHQHYADSADTRHNSFPGQQVFIQSGYLQQTSGKFAHVKHLRKNLPGEAVIVAKAKPPRGAHALSHADRVKQTIVVSSIRWTGQKSSVCKDVTIHENQQWPHHFLCIQSGRLV